MELISREELLKQIETDSKGHEGQYGDEWLFIDTINSIPTIEERNEGEWINKYKNDSYLECSVCQYPIIGRLYQKNWLIVPYNYCPNCGAKMKGE